MKFKDFIMQFSFQERKKRNLEKYEKKINRLKNLSINEFNYLYVELQRKYHFKKNTASFFLVALLISIITGIWNKFLSFGQKALVTYFSQASNEKDIAMFTFIFLFLVVLIMSLSVGIIIFLYLKSLSDIKKELIIMEQVKGQKRRKNKYV